MKPAVPALIKTRYKIYKARAILRWNNNKIVLFIRHDYFTYLSIIRTFYKRLNIIMISDVNVLVFKAPENGTVGVVELLYDMCTMKWHVLDVWNTVALSVRYYRLIRWRFYTLLIGRILFNALYTERLATK